MYFYSVPTSKLSNIENVHLTAFIYVSCIILFWQATLSNGGGLWVLHHWFTAMVCFL
jgi:hypothetical protein